MKQITRVLGSSLGKKYVMAVTGLALFGFVIVHMLGNLQIFLPSADGTLRGDALNSYAHKLKSLPGLLWTFRIGLLVLVVIHVATAIRLSIENKKARGAVGYDKPAAAGASYASRTMIWSGLILLSFIIYHLLHFTVAAFNPDYLEYRTPEGDHNVYKMVVMGFKNPLVSGFYILSMGLLCMHLSHGVKSMLQSVGITRARWEGSIDVFAKTAAWIIFIGNSSIPLAVLLGLLSTQ